jgi:2-methylisocitrate lyase-like PEP mutase family enzyme
MVEPADLSRTKIGRGKSKTMRDDIASLRTLLRHERGVIVPGAANALAARIIADLGFKAIYLTGAGVTNTYLGLPDLSFVDLSQLAQHTMAIRNITDLPIIVDADTGFGNAINVTHTVRVLESAGASAIQIEDQLFPKRCGHFDGQELVSVGEMTTKIAAAVEARRTEIVVIARTDARSAEGFDSAIARATRYIEAGADMTFVEAPRTVEEMRQIPRQLSVPQMLNLVVGGKTPVIDHKQAGEMGFSLVLYANVALQAAIKGMQAALGSLRDKGMVSESDQLTAAFAERQRLVDKEYFDALGRRLAGQEE